jgi:hypothetical protein
MRAAKSGFGRSAGKGLTIAIDIKSALRPFEGIQFGEQASVLIVRGFEYLRCALGAEDGGSSEHRWRMTSGGETCRKFGFEAIDEQTATNG